MLKDVECRRDGGGVRVDVAGCADVILAASQRLVGGANQAVFCEAGA